MSKNLKERQRRAAQLIALGRSGRAVAEELKVTPETVSRWRSDPAFLAELNSVLNDAAHTARHRLRNLVDDAVSVVEEVIRDSDNPVKVRLDAASRVLANCGLNEVGMGGGAEEEDAIEADQRRQDAYSSMLSEFDPFSGS